MNQESISTHEEQTESQEHIDEMVAKSDELDRLNDPSQGDRPDWLPEKFKNAEQMAEAYGHLEKKLGGESVEEGVEPEAASEPTPQQEASDELNIPLGTIKSRLKIGLRELKKVYNP